MKKSIVVFIILIFLAIVGGVIFAQKQTEEIYTKSAADEIEVAEKEVVEEVIPEKEEPIINIYQGNQRPMAFMIDNNVNAQPHSAINKAYMVYEIIVEGGETRLMAIFKGIDEDLPVGPIRSARHYFLDYAMENDVIYCHLGMSPQAEEQMGTFKIDHINGQSYDTGKARTDSSLYWRVSHKKAPHNAYTSLESIQKIATQKKWRKTSDRESVLNYVSSEVVLDREDAINANTVTIPYTGSHKVKYVYDEATGRYTRWSKGKVMKEEISGEEITTKNIIITLAENYTLDDKENKGRQDVITVGELDGYYITNGKAIKIKCIKESREKQTKYVDLDGKEIEVNDGNTFVNICPIDANILIEE